MPVKIGQIIAVPEQPYVDLVPDVRTDVPLDFVPTISMEQPFGIPTNFNDLPKDQQEQIMARYRFMGIRLRHDIKDRTIPLTKETLDIP